MAGNLNSGLNYLITTVTPLLTVCHILLLVCPLGENLTDKFWSFLLKPCHSGILCVCLNFLLFIYRILQTFTFQIRINFENSKIRRPKTTTYKIMLWLFIYKPKDILSRWAAVIHSFCIWVKEHNLIEKFHLLSSP